MKIGIYISHYSPESGGAYSFQQSILETLEKYSFHHEIFIFYYGLEIHKESKVKYIPLFRKNKTPINRITEKVKRIFKKFKSEEILTPLREAIEKHNISFVWFLTPAYENVKVPYAYTVWDLQHRIQPFFPEVSITGWNWSDRENAYNEVLPQATYVITGTEQGKQEIMHFYAVEKNRIKIIPLPTPSFSSQNNMTSNKISDSVKISEPFVFYPAQFWPHKNHIRLLLAIKLLKEKYLIDMKLVFTGSDKGNLKYIKEKAAEFRLENNLIILGFVNYEDLIYLYKSALALVFPSFFGPDNLPPLEAFSLGCPVIVADVPGAREQLGNAALFVNPKSEEDICLAIEKLYNNKDYKDELIRKGKIRAESWTSIDYVNEMMKALDEFETYRICWSSNETYTHS